MKGDVFMKNEKDDSERETEYGHTWSDDSIR